MSNALLQRWEYRDTEKALPLVSVPVEPTRMPPVITPEPGITEEQVAARVTSALAEAEQRWDASFREHERRSREELQIVLRSFAAERARYFRDIEAEVVQLALSIARKILGREAHFDPELLVGLVRTALDRIGAASTVKVRVPPEDLATWKNAQELGGSAYAIEVAADESLKPGDCVVETDLGSANFGLNAQFKQVEEGLLDIMRRRPFPKASEEPAGASGSERPTG